MNRGLAYDSDGGRAYAAALTSLMQAEAALQSARISRDQGGPFAGYAVNREPYLKVMRQHRDAAYRIDAPNVPEDLLDATLVGWDEVVALGEKSGFRNGQLSVLAPTGTIAFMMDCDTTGVEPDIALIKYKRLVGGGYLKIVNQTVPHALKALGYTADQTERSSPSSTSTRRSRARRTSPPSTSTSSTAPSSRPTARGRSTTTAT